MTETQTTESGLNMINKVSFIVMILVAITFWLGGYDFNSRGDMAVLSFLTIIGTGLFLGDLAEFLKEM